MRLVIDIRGFLLLLFGASIGGNSVLLYFGVSNPLLTMILIGLSVACSLYLLWSQIMSHSILYNEADKLDRYLAKIMSDLEDSIEEERRKENNRK